MPSAMNCETGETTMRWTMTGIMWLGLMVTLMNAQAPVTPPPATKTGLTPGLKPVEATPLPVYPELDAENLKYLNAYLAAWEKRMTSVEGLETKIRLTEVDGGEKTVYNGEATILRPNYAKMFLRQTDDPTNVKRWRHYIADGKYLWDYQYKSKVAKVAQLPKDNIGENTLLSFLFGMKADEIKKRYHMTIDMKDPAKFNDNYISITIYPKTREDMQEFAKAELVLWKNNKDPKYADFWMLPARLWFQHPNKNQVMWEFLGMNTQKKLIPKDFAAMAFPDKEWKPEWAIDPNAKQPSPTVIRPTSNGSSTVTPPK